MTVEIEKHLPEYYNKSRYAKALLKTQDAEFKRLYALLDAFLKNRFIDSADEENVKKLEECFSLTAVGSLDERKNAIKAKMRGARTVTAQSLKAVAESYGALTDVEENPEDYSFLVIFHQPDVSEDTIKAAIDDLKPAHLAAVYSYEYAGTFEMSGSESEYTPDSGFSDGNGSGGYLGNEWE